MTLGQPLLAVLMFEEWQDKTNELRRRGAREEKLLRTNLNLLHQTGFECQKPIPEDVVVLKSRSHQNHTEKKISQLIKNEQLFFTQ